MTLTMPGLVCALLLISTGRTLASNECTLNEVFDWMSGSIDLGILASQGCIDIKERIPYDCCDAVASIVSHQCAPFIASTLTYNPPPLLYTLYHIMRTCGLGLGVGWNDTVVALCGNGILDDSEQCDDMNDISGDGCTKCFIDSGFDCHQPVSDEAGMTSFMSTILAEEAASESFNSDTLIPSTVTSITSEVPFPSSTRTPPVLSENDTLIESSVCRFCDEECALVHRETCVVSGEPCGPCLTGYQEVEATGLCVAKKRVFYTAIDRYYYPEQLEADLIYKYCTFHEVGVVLEGSPNRTAAVYVDAVREWRPDRSDFGNNGSCWMEWAIYMRPEGGDVVVVAELLLPELKSISSRAKGNDHIVFFTDPTRPRAMVVGDNDLAFKVHWDSVVYLYNLDISDCSGYHGSAVRSYGTFIMENVTVSGCHENPLTDPFEMSDVGFVFMCEGTIAFFYGSVTMRDVVWRNNTAFDVADSACVMKYDSFMTVSGHLLFSNVVFEDNLVVGAMLSAKVALPGSSIRNLTIVRNNSQRSSLVEMFSDLSFHGLVARGNTGLSGAVLHLAAESLIEDFYVSDNEALDTAGIVLNMGKSVFRNGIVARNSGTSDMRGSIVNRGRMVVNNTIFEENRKGAIDSSSSLLIYDSVFSGNEAEGSHSTIWNAGGLEINDSEFYDNGRDVTIKSNHIFVVRNSVVPNPTSMPIAECGEVVTLSGAEEYALCGLQAQCEPSSLNGINCTCAHGYWGDPLSVCGLPARVHVLPDTSVVAFAPKTAALTYEEEIRLVSDGLGAVTWTVDPVTLPPWLSLTPSTGHFENEGFCASDMRTVILTFITQGFRGNDTTRNAEVRMVSNSTFESQATTAEVTLAVLMEVEVTINATESIVYPHPSCMKDNDGICHVAAGSVVHVVVEAVDVEGLPLGVGGSTPSIRVLSVLDPEFDSNPLSSSGLVLVAMRDFHNGTFEAEFDAPQTHFAVFATVNSEVITGSPILYSVECQDGWAWDPDSYRCAEVGPTVPFLVMIFAVTVISSAVLLVFSYLWRKRKYFEELFLLVLTEVTSLALCGIGELFDLLSDIGAFVSVALSDDLSAYVPYYSVVVAIAVISGVWYLCVVASDLRKTINSRKYSAAAKVLGRGSRASTTLRQSVFVAGKGRLETLEEVDEVASQLTRQLRRMKLELTVLVVEDTPMLILGTILMIHAGESVPINVVIALQITCVMIGITLTNLRGIKDVQEQISRLTQRREAILKELSSADPVQAPGNRRTPEPHGCDSGRLAGSVPSSRQSVARGKQEHGVANAILQFCVIS
eukprot:Rmarinus@m.22497